MLQPFPNLDMQTPRRAQNIFITTLPKIIFDQLIRIRQEMHQLVPLTPLRPIRQSLRAIIRVQLIDETQITALDSAARDSGRNAVCCQYIGGVKRSEDGGTVAVGCDV